MAHKWYKYAMCFGCAPQVDIGSQGDGDPVVIMDGSYVLSLACESDPKGSNVFSANCEKISLDFIPPIMSAMHPWQTVHPADHQNPA